MFAGKNVLKHLEADKILSMLAAKSRSELGVTYALQLVPAKDYAELCSRQKLFAEIENYRDTKGELPWQRNLVPVEELINSAKENGLLTGAELIKIRLLLKTATELRRIFVSNSVEYTSFSLLTRYLHDYSEETGMLDVLDEDGRLFDSASEKLKAVREEMRLIREQIRTRSRNMLNEPSIASMLQERLLVLRNSRHTFLVRQDAVNKFPGIVVDRSGSGNSVYMEPNSLIRLNNSFSDRRSVEYHEELRILRSLTEKLLIKRKGILAAEKVLGNIDFFYALSEKIRLDGWKMPVLTDKAVFKLKNARHPLLGSRAVPIDIECGEKFKTLVITGPNTGGKTVALKTAGISVLLAWYGCPLPADESTVIGNFERLCADIGDEQSIEQSLSTFSAHIKNITEILSSAGDRSLIMLDELGAGTDPDEGAALGIALLNWLLEKRSVVLATTHYNPIKHFATLTKGIETASVEFNVETLSPTYKIIMGIPGQSNALLIASKLGMPNEIIKRAENAISSHEVSMEAIVSELHKKRAQLEKEGCMLDENRKKTDKLKKDYEEKVRKLDEKRDELLASADKKARNIIKNAEDSARALIKNLETAEQESAARRELEKKRSHFSKIAGSADKREEKKIAKQSVLSSGINHKLELGDTVKLIGTSGNATVLEIRGKKAVLQAGAAQLEVPLAKLAFVKKGEEQKKLADIKIKVERPVNVPSSIMIRHLRVDEALPMLEQYLDRAYRAGYDSVMVIHGRGEGILRRAVQSLCEEIPYVAEHNLGGPHEGGYGVTVVKFTK